MVLKNPRLKSCERIYTIVSPSAARILQQSLFPSFREQVFLQHPNDIDILHSISSSFLVQLFDPVLVVFNGTNVNWSKSIFRIIILADG